MRSHGCKMAEKAFTAFIKAQKATKKMPKVIAKSLEQLGGEGKAME